MIDIYKWSLRWQTCIKLSQIVFTYNIYVDFIYMEFPISFQESQVDSFEVICTNRTLSQKTSLLHISLTKFRVHNYIQAIYSKKWVTFSLFRREN